MGENISERSVHATLECKLPSCRKAFTPKRRNQDFCSKEHRLEYHVLAREKGERILRRKKLSHYAQLSHSPRLQRVFRLLKDREYHSTRDIMRRADVCAVNSCISELRANGFVIDTQYSGGHYEYRLAGG